MPPKKPPAYGAQLIRRDPRFAPVVELVAPFETKPLPQPDREPYQALIQAVAHQQLNGKAARTILGRFFELFPRHKAQFPPAKAIVRKSIEDLRSVGFSNSKSPAILDIATQQLAGRIPSTAEMAQLDDEDIIRQLVPLRGVGRWTVEMLLIFQLGRINVLPVDDFAVRGGYQLLASLPEPPKPKELKAIGEQWQPIRSVASWYLWRWWEYQQEAAKTPLPAG